MQNKNKKIGWIVGGVIVLIAAFYGGMVYGGNNVRASINSRGQRGVGAQAFGGGAGATSGFNRGAAGGGFTAGQIIAKDDKSITVSIMGGGSKIIFLDTNTKISKQTDGTAADLAVGTQVLVTGASNTDGSLNAQMVQIRPAMQATKPAQ